MLTMISSTEKTTTFFYAVDDFKRSNSWWLGEKNMIQFFFLLFNSNHHSNNNIMMMMMMNQVNLKKSYGNLMLMFIIIIIIIEYIKIYTQFQCAHGLHSTFDMFIGPVSFFLLSFFFCIHLFNTHTQIWQWSLMMMMMMVMIGDAMVLHLQSFFVVVVVDSQWFKKEKFGCSTYFFCVHTTMIKIFPFR